MKKKYNITSQEAFTLHTKTTKTILLHRTYCSKPLLGNKRFMLDEIVLQSASKLVIIYLPKKKNQNGWQHLLQMNAKWINNWGIFHIKKYGKSCSVLLVNFIKHKPLIFLKRESKFRALPSEEQCYEFAPLLRHTDLSDKSLVGLLKLSR